MFLPYWETFGVYTRRDKYGAIFWGMENVGSELQRKLSTRLPGLRQKVMSFGKGESLHQVGRGKAIGSHQHQEGGKFLLLSVRLISSHSLKVRQYFLDVYVVNRWKGELFLMCGREAGSWGDGVNYRHSHYFAAWYWIWFLPCPLLCTLKNLVLIFTYAQLGSSPNWNIFVYFGMQEVLHLGYRLSIKYF